MRNNQIFLTNLNFGLAPSCRSNSTIQRTLDCSAFSARRGSAFPSCARDLSRHFFYLGRRLIDGWPNTFVFTKAIAENTVLRYGSGMPVCIVRPSIVTSTWKEPIMGWADSLYGSIGLLVSSSLGLLRTIHCHTDKNLDFVPADYVTSCLIAAAWHTSTR